MIDKETFLEKLKNCENKFIPYQGKISIPVLRRICLKMQHGIKFMPIHVSSENIIVNGHHRYVGSVIAEYELDMVGDYPKPSFENEIEWKNVEFMDEDWDAPAKVKILNEEDAAYNSMSIKEIEGIIEQK